MSILNLENKRLLVVEDDEMSFLYLNQLLILTKCSFVREKTGIDSIDRFRNERNFDLVLMDIQLPDMDGKQVTREIRSIDSKITIIAQTASRSVIEREMIIEAGCTEIISKPYTMEEFYSILAKYF